MKRRYWTDKEIEYLKKQYPDNNTLIIANHLNRSYSAVAGKALDLGIKKSEAFRNSELSGRLNGTQGGLMRFKKGHTPWNKGKKGIHIGGKETQFKPGHLPHNTRHDGAMSIRDGYWYIRLSKGVWKEMHRHVWEQQHGPIPEGHNVIFLDGNKKNYELDNLALVSNAELMIKNTIHRYPEDLKKLMKLNGKLKSKIKNYEKQD